MTARITNEDLDIMLNRYTNAADALGMIGEGETVCLQHGSKTNGIAFRVYTLRPGSSGHSAPPAGYDFLGMTKAETYNLLADRARVLEDVAYSQK